MKPLSKSGKSDVAKCKARIQKLLTAIVRAKGGCIFRNYPVSGQCSGYVAADHIISRQHSLTYADSRNVIGACQRHHIYWKPQNPTLYAEIVEDYLGEKGWAWIKKCEKYIFQHSTHKVLYDWSKEEAALKQELEALKGE